MFCIILLDMGGSSLLWVEPSLDRSCHGACTHLLDTKICYVWKVQNRRPNDSDWKAHGADFPNVMLF